MAKVLQGGLLDEYNADGQYNFTAHVEAQLVALEQLSPASAPTLRARFEALRNRRYVYQDHINSVAKSISSELEAFAPDGMYFGRPHSSSNCLGFWPADWLKFGAKVPTNAEARQLSRCVIG